MKKLSREERKWRNQFLFTPLIVTLLAVGLLFACTFLPILTAGEELSVYIERNPDGNDIAGDILTNEQARNVSMLKYFKIQCYVQEVDEPLEIIVGTVLFCGSAILAVGIFLLVIHKHPIPAMLLNLAGLGLHKLSIQYILDESERALKKYDWSIVYDLFYIAFALVFAGSIWMLIKKIMFKRELRTDYILAQLEKEL